MYYYLDGFEGTNGKVRKIISNSETEIAGRTAMNASEAVAILEQYANEDRVIALKKMLADTDYIACKIAEGAATVEEYAEAIEQRQAWREEINRIEANV